MDIQIKNQSHLVTEFFKKVASEVIAYDSDFHLKDKFKQLHAQDLSKLRNRMPKIKQEEMLIWPPLQ